MTKTCDFLYPTLIDSDENKAYFKTDKFKTRMIKDTLVKTKTAKINTIVITKTAEKLYPFGPHIHLSPYTGKKTLPFFWGRWVPFGIYKMATTQAFTAQA